MEHILFRIFFGLMMNIVYYEAYMVVWQSSWKTYLNQKYPADKRFSWLRGHYVWEYKEKEQYVDEWDEWDLQNR